MSFRPVPRDWTTNEVTSWINGLEDGLIEYKRNLGKLNGAELFDLDSTQLETLGVFKCGHQEAILDSISLLLETFNAESGQSSENNTGKRTNIGSLKYATQQLASKCSALQTIRPTNQPLPIGHQQGVNAINSNKLSNQQLELVIAVLTQVRQVCCFLAGVLDQSHADYSKFVKIALELSQTALQPLPAWLGIEPITSCCVELCQIADKIQRNQAAQHYPTTETVTIKRDSNNSLGLFLRQRPVDGTLEITGAKEQSHAFGLVRTGDELIAINNQVIVGWSLSNVVQLLKNCGECAELMLKRKGNVRMTIHSRSQSTPEVWLPSDSDRLSINRRRSAGPNVNSGPNGASSHHRRKPILSLPPPPPEPYRPKRPHSMDMRAHSVGNLTGSESPNSLMDAAVSMSQVSLPTSSGSDMYFKVVYEDPERPKVEGTQSTAGPGGAFSSSVDKLIDEQEKNLIKQLESTSLSQSQRSSQVPLNDEPSRYSHNYHSRQGSVASGRTGYSTSHSNLSASSMDNLEGSHHVLSNPPPVNSQITSQKAVTDSMDSIPPIPDHKDSSLREQIVTYL